MEDVINATKRTKGKVVDDFKSMVNDADDLLKETAKVSGDEFKIVREKFAEKLKSAKASLIDAEQIVVEKTKQAATVTDDYVKSNPWTAASIAAGFGILIGFLAAKR
jgi:ElaB/YqjD/DUF883 family membrane-anchored ribosome-binding protein